MSAPNGRTKTASVSPSGASEASTTGVEYILSPALSAYASTVRILPRYVLSAVSRCWLNMLWMSRTLVIASRVASGHGSVGDFEVVGVGVGLVDAEADDAPGVDADDRSVE